MPFSATDDGQQPHLHLCPEPFKRFYAEGPPRRYPERFAYAHRTLMPCGLSRQNELFRIACRKIVNQPSPEDISSGPEIKHEKGKVV